MTYVKMDIIKKIIPTKSSEHGFARGYTLTPLCKFISS